MAGHNGTVFKYTINNQVNKVNAEIYLERINNLFYTGNTDEMTKAIGELAKNSAELDVF